MAAFDATLSGANATSYVSLERARDLVIDTPHQAAWEAMDDAAKRSALNAATFWMETLKYHGSRCGIPSVDDPTKPQALQWPRSGVTCNGYTAACDLIPYKIEFAQVLLALNLAASPDSITGPIGGGNNGSTPAGTYVASQELGDLKISYNAFPAGATNDCVTCDTPKLIAAYPWLEGLLGCWVDLKKPRGGVILRVRS